MENKNKTLAIATEVLRKIYTPTIQEQLEQSIRWERMMPPKPPLPWYKKLLRRYKIHMYNYCEAIAERHVAEYHEPY